MDALCVYFWATTPVLISILTFTTYAVMGHKLTAAKVRCNTSELGLIYIYNVYSYTTWTTSTFTCDRQLPAFKIYEDDVIIVNVT